MQAASCLDLTPEGAWQMVLSGRYRIVNWYDRSGRRYVVAARQTSSSDALTPRQKRALTLRASGAALKVIAYELGVSLSTAGRELERAMTRVGLASHADVAAVFGHG